jgi:hypothetical protein
LARGAWNYKAVFFFALPTDHNALAIAYRARVFLIDARHEAFGLHSVKGSIYSGW